MPTVNKEEGSLAFAQIRLIFQFATDHSQFASKSRRTQT